MEKFETNFNHSQSIESLLFGHYIYKDICVRANKGKWWAKENKTMVIILHYVIMMFLKYGLCSCNIWPLACESRQNRMMHMRHEKVKLFSRLWPAGGNFTDFGLEQFLDIFPEEI